MMYEGQQMSGPSFQQFNTVKMTAQIIYSLKQAKRKLINGRRDEDVQEQ